MEQINSFPHNEILDWSKFKAFADDKTILAQKLKSMLERVENIVGKVENAGYQHFLHFPRFQKLSVPEVVKVGIVWLRVKYVHKYAQGLNSCSSNGSIDRCCV